MKKSLLSLSLALAVVLSACGKGPEAGEPLSWQPPQAEEDRELPPVADDDPGQEDDNPPLPPAPTQPYDAVKQPFDMCRPPYRAT